VPPVSEQTTWREAIPEGEAARLDALAKRLLGSGRLDGRPLHRKALAALHARFEVSEAPRDLRHGLFAEPGSYDAFVRFSSGAGQARNDRVPDVRGLAVKILGVTGPKVIPGLETATTQDFLAILSPTFPFKDPAAFVDIAVASRRGKLAVIGAVLRHYGPLGLFAALPRLQRTLDSSMRSLAERTYFTAVPLRLGPHAVKLRFRPMDVPPPVPPVVDEARTPIEDPTVEWAERDAPWVPLARLAIPAQTAESRAGRALAAYVERLSFDPWHALVEHRPLGVVMRARAVAYRRAVAAHGAISELEVKPPSTVMA